jgi:FKBP-type peptidyl-prolyl cis-trans isomerase FkpA
VAVSGKTVQRITIIIIALVMTVGTLGAYFIVIMQQNDQQQATKDQQTKYPDYPVDATAYKVEGSVKELVKTDLKTGEGAEAKTGDKVKVHYKGTFAQDGKKFDSSYDTGEPVEFELTEGKVIDGWVQGVPGMKEGGKRRLEVPSALGYGPTGYPGAIPPNSDLVFEIELISVTPKQ